MKQILISSLIVVLTVTSCQQQQTYQVTDSKMLYDEYLIDTSEAVDKYVNQIIELTGTFTKNGDFKVYNYDSVNNSYSYSPITVFSDLAMSDNISPAQLNVPWYYNKETKQVIDESSAFRIDENGVLMGQGAHLFSMEDVFRLFKDIKEGVTYTTNDLDRILHKYIKDESVIQAMQHNQVAIHEGQTYGDLVVIDRVRIHGIVSGLQKTDNGMFIHLKEAKIIGTARVFDFNNLPVIDYREVNQILTNKEVVSISSDTATLQQ